MSKIQKNINLTENIDTESKLEEKSVSSIVSEDKNNITDATLEAQKNINSIAYADNLVPPCKTSKSIRALKIEDKKNEEILPEETKKLENINEIENNIDESIEITPDNISTNKKTHKTLIIVLSTIFIIALLLFILSTIFALFTSYSNTIINGVTIKGIDISGLNKEDAYKKVSTIFNNKLSESFILKHNEYELEVFPEQFGISFDIEKAINKAYSKGRSSNIFQNNYEILSSMFLGININPGFSYSEETLDSLSAEMETNFSDRLIEPTYYIENNNLIISKGKDGVVIDKSKLLSEITYYINNLHVKTPIINIPIQQKTASTIDLQKIHDEVYRAPKDAYYTTNPYAIYPHADGVDFAVPMEEANKILAGAGEQTTIPLKVLSPTITTYQLGTEAFPHLLGSYSTTFSTRNVNRTTNIKLATAKINGTVIMPGETFSYNQVVGQRTAAAGFKSAAVYVGGQVTNGIGGGICQVSSTLYNTVLLGNLEIVERHNHGFNTGYVPVGRDATVSWGGPDFKFKNTRNYPVKILASVSGGKLTVDVYGLKSDNEYEVEIQSWVTSYIKYKTIERKDYTLAKGKTKVIEQGSNGCKSVAYRILKQNGQIISKTLLSKDTYNPHNRIVAVGIK